MLILKKNPEIRLKFTFHSIEMTFRIPFAQPNHEPRHLHVEDQIISGELTLLPSSNLKL
jgi:hypothetical protein